MLAILFSPDASHDALFLANYATILIRDELVRVPGVAGVALFGADDSGRVACINGVARVDLKGVGRWPYARLDGKPAVALAPFPILKARPREVGAAIGRKLSELRSLFPPDIDLCTRFDFTANPKASDASARPGYLLVEANLPSSASPERTRSILDRCRVVLQGTEGVQNVLELSESPFGFRGISPCLVVRLSDAHGKQTGPEDLVSTIRDRLHRIEGATFRLCDLSNPNGYPPAGFPIDLALSGPEDGPVREVGQRLIERLRQGGKLIDVGWDPRYASAPQLYVDIDRAKAATQGVPLGNVFDTLQVFLGSLYAGHFNSLGHVPDIRHLKVRNRHGEMIPLETLVTIRETAGVPALDRLDGRPTVEITANLASGVPLAEARALCETAAEQLRLMGKYRLTWIRELPSPKPIVR
jgi:multidrug efflux pump subunit AcrB